MSIGLLYESEEWSTYALQSRIEEQGIPCRLVCMEGEIPWEQLSGCDLVVSRVFASAQFRGHERSLSRMPELIAYLKEKQIPMLNPYQAHFYEVSKELSTRVLKEHGLPAPEVYGIFRRKKGFGPEAVLGALPAEIKYPCILKPDCGGRTTYTYIIHSEKELEDTWGRLPDIEMPAEEYIEPADESACVTEVAQGRADGFIYDQLTIYRNWQKNPDTTDAIFIPFQEPEKWGIAVQKGNTELLSEVNAFLKEFREEGGYDRLVETYLSEEKEAFEELGFQWFFDLADETDGEKE